jgi:hypothetical protein
MKTKVKNIITFLHNKEVAHEDYYNWDKLESDLKDGYDEKRPMEVLRLFDGRFILVEGRHRLSLIKKLYGDDYEVEVKKTYMLKVLMTYIPFLTIATIWYLLTLIKSAFKRFW